MRACMAWSGVEGRSQYKLDPHSIDNLGLIPGAEVAGINICIIYFPHR